MPREAKEEVKEQYVITPWPTSIFYISLRILNRPLLCSEYRIFLTVHPTDSSPVPKRQSQRATSTASEELRKPIATRFIFPALSLQSYRNFDARGIKGRVGWLIRFTARMET